MSSYFGYKSEPIYIVHQLYMYKEKCHIHHRQKFQHIFVHHSLLLLHIYKDDMDEIYFANELSNTPLM